jgi:inosine/xanthosine triphosphatase
MNQIVVASTNPVKIEAVRLGFAHMFPDAVAHVTGLAVPSGVADQPLSDGETYQGARNRTDAAQAAQPDANYWVGIEGGLERIGDQLRGFAWIIVRDKAQMGESRTATFTLPQEVTRLVQQGYELGHADDMVFQRRNSKQANGSVGILTDDALTRTDYYVQAVVLALIPFKNRHLTFTQEGK